MSNTQSTVTILTCNQKGKKATKIFKKNDDGSIEKIQFSAGIFFTHEELPVSNIDDLSKILSTLESEPSKFIIRGKPKENAKEFVRRMCNGPDAAFDNCARPYVMLDFDKLPCPVFFDMLGNPEEAIEWVVSTLPKCFGKASCYWQFSASQNVVCETNQETKNSISLHLYFYFDREMSDQELKYYFKDNSIIDKALFSPVQIHYTARPIFEGMKDPLLIRSGILKKDNDIVFMPEVKIPENKDFKRDIVVEPVVTSDNWNKAIDLFAPYYQKGSRDRFCGAVAGTLYRGGWSPDNAANFVYELADTMNDEEANERYSGALRIFDAIDNNRPAQGIPTLKDEFDIKNLEEILQILGIGAPDIIKAINKLDGTKDIDKIKKVINMVVKASFADQAAYIDLIKSTTPYSKKVLNEFVKEAKDSLNQKPAVDLVDITMERFLKERFEGGRLLLRGEDSQFWYYNGKYWKPKVDDFIKNELIPYARQAVIESEERVSANVISNGVINFLTGRVYRDNNPIYNNENISSVINCRNGELWLKENGDYSFLPHLPESYQQHCLDVDFEPSAKAPLFDEGVLQIFANCDNPEDMARHYEELAGYICQPWRKIAKIVLFHGHGRNGKTSLIGIIQKVLGINMVMSDRVSDIEGDVFKTGDLVNKLMFLDEDVSEGTLLPDGFLKKISEEKMLTGQRKYKPPFQFICRALPVLLTNSFPRTSDTSGGIKRRIMVIPFSRQFTEEEDKIGLFDDIWEKKPLVF